MRFRIQFQRNRVWGAKVAQRTLHATSGFVEERIEHGGTAVAEKFLAAMKITESSIVLPPWICDVYLVEKRNDWRGIDAVVETFAGPLYIQIMSSEWELRKHFTRFIGRGSSKKNAGAIAVIVINPCDTPDKIRKVARAVLDDLRKKVHLRPRLHYAD